MPIDPSMVKWDEEAPRVEVRGTKDSLEPQASIDPRMVKWEKEGTGVLPLDMANAGATGYNRGLLRLAGLPVDTVANVLDLGKAAIGAPLIALSGKPVPSWLEPSDRKKIVGSGDYLIDKASSNAVGDALLNPANPDYEGGYIQNAGQALAGGVLRPATAAQAVNQAILAGTSSAAGKYVGDRTGNAALAIAAGMSPVAIQNAGTSAVQMGVRGLEPGRRRMEQRIQDLKNAGVDSPTLGLASGNSMIGGVENLLQNTPGAVDLMRTARAKAMAGLQGNVQGAADIASTNRGTLEAGTAIQRGLNGPFRTDTRATTKRLYDALGNEIPPLTPVDVSGTSATLARLNPTIPGAPNLSPMFQNSRMMGIERALNADASPPAGAFTPSQIRAAMATNPANLEDLNAALNATRPNQGTLPFTAVKQLRTAVGEEIDNSSIMSDVPRSKWNPLYGALSEDIRGAAAQVGPAATNAFNRANNYNRAVIGRMEDIAPFADAKTPETAFRMYQRAAEDNLSTLRAVKKSLPEDARGSAAGTVIDRLGRAKSGQQDETGGVWSTETFLTNWNKMTPATRQELFSGFQGSADVKGIVDSVAKATSMMRDNSRLWANPSGTGANVAARGTLGAIGLGGAGAAAGLVSPLIPLAAGGGVLGANMLARSLTSPRVVRAMASRNYLDPGLQMGTGGSLLSGNLLRDYGKE